MNSVRLRLARGLRMPRTRDGRIYMVLLVVALAFPVVAQVATNNDGNYLISQGADAGVYVLLALGLNIVAGAAGLLDLGYAAFFAIGAYTYALFASGTLGYSPLQHAFHIPFWVLLFVAMFLAAAFGGLLGAPTLRLRGDYLAIVTLGFGEIVPRVFRNVPQWTNGVNGISALDPPQIGIWLLGPWSGQDLGFVNNYQFTSADPSTFYGVVLVLIICVVLLMRNLFNSRIGRALAAIREDDTAANAVGVNVVTTKLLAFALGASLSGFAGVFYAAKLSLVSPENFGLVVSITVLVMVVVGGMGSIPGAIVGALAVYYMLFALLPGMSPLASAAASSLGLGWLDQPSGNWPGIGVAISEMKYLVFGILLLGMILLRPEGLIPTRIRHDELKNLDQRGSRS